MLASHPSGAATAAGAAGFGQGHGPHGFVRARMCVITVTSTDEAQPIARYTTDCSAAALRRY